MLDNGDILIVDDELINYRLLEAILKRQGLSTVYAENGYKAVEMVRDTEYNVVIMDLKMSGIDGVETSKQIRCMRPYIKIIASSAKKIMDKEECALFDDFIPKPINRMQLLSVVEKYVK